MCTNYLGKSFSFDFIFFVVVAASGGGGGGGMLAMLAAW